MSNPKRRDNEQSLLADLRRRVSWLEQRRTPAGAKKLDDLSDVSVPSPSQLNVLTFSGTQWQALPSVAGDMAVTEAIAVYDNSEDATFSFDEVGGDSWTSPAFVVAANSYQLVLVTVDVSVSDSEIGAVNSTGAVGGTGFSVGFPTPWIAEVRDVTNDPSGLAMSKGNGSGSCGCTVPIWLRNETDEEASLTVDVAVYGYLPVFPSAGFDGTVLVRAESVFSIAAVTP